MTRQKKELHKKIQAIEDFIAVDTELGCGFAPAGFYETLYAEINGLQEQLASLRLASWASIFSRWAFQVLVAATR